MKYPTLVRRLALVLTVSIAVVSVADADTPLVSNGDMSLGDAAPAGWTEPFTSEGKLNLVRDTAEFTQGPASLRLESVAGIATGNVGLDLPDAAGKSFVVTAMAKSALVDATYRQASIVVFVRDDAGKALAWQELANVSHAGEWTPIRARVSVPPEGTNTQLVVYLRGNGAVWLDEVELHPVGSAPPPSPVITDFDDPFNFDYQDWKNRAVADDGLVRIHAPGTRGGAGINGSWDLAGHEDRSPSLRLRVDEGNEAKQIRLRLTDADGTVGAWTYDLPEAGSGFVSLVPEQAMSAVEPNKLDKPGDTEGLDLSKLTQVQVQGEWRPDPVAITIDRIELLAATPELLAERAAGVKRRTQAEQRRRDREAKREAQRIEEREKFLADVPRDAGSPRVVHVAPVAQDILGITIDAGRVVYAEPVKYVPQPDDRLRRSDKTALGWRADGTIGPVDRSTVVIRGKEQIGMLTERDGMLLPHERIEGHALFMPTVDETASYRVVSADDPTPAGGMEPVAVYRKSRVTNLTRPERKPAMRHTVYLKLPQPLRDGATYTVHFPGVNTQRPSVDYVHDSRRAVTEALHVTQVGFRPDDPYKRGFLSIWLGNGGGQRFDTSQTTFEVLRDDTDEVVHRGPIRLVMAAEDAESIRGGKNHNQTDVYELAFDELSQPGRYRLHVPGLGSSKPFEIGADVWAESFRVSMEGFLTHRSGIELGPPTTTYRRPRPFHPEDGVRIYQTSASTIAGESAAIDAAFVEQLAGANDASALVEVPEAWGGYMDAGDWDRRSLHLYATDQHLALLKLFPDYFASLRLALPAEEAENGLPDLLDEALFHLDFYRRIQQPDGGVRGGVESSAHPIGGETSWRESLLIGVFKADAMSSYSYAATAARAARVLAPIDSARSRIYHDTAIKAWDWALQHQEASILEIPSDKKFRTVRRLWNARLRAAVELYALTGDQSYHDDFKRSLEDAQAAKVPSSQLQDAMFAYAHFLPEEATDPELYERAIGMIIRLADQSIEFGDGNAFGLATDEHNLPVMGYTSYYSTPSMGYPSLLYAHVLTGDEKYLAAAIRASNSAVGANPGNRTYTTGLGHTYPKAPLHIDSRVTGQPAPRGITVYGPSDPAEDFGFNTWMHQHFLKDVFPDSRTWPTSEAYLDVYLWPAMNEYTITQTMGPTSFHFGYLAARGQTPHKPSASSPTDDLVKP